MVAENFIVESSSHGTSILAENLENTHSRSTEEHGLVRGFGLLQATALNMSNMVGVGPFITIPLIIASMGGPQCMLGWLLGAVLALCDGLVWSELAAAMPGTGGTYLYLREAFRKTRLGGMLPFLFIWQFIFSGPLEIASGYIGFAQYVGYFWRGMGPAQTRLVSLAVGVLVIVLLYRGITAVGRLTVVLWVGMLVTVFWIIASGLANFNAKVAFDFPPDAFTFSTGFATGLGSAMLIAMYDFMGYYDICYVGGEVRNPERVIPRSIIFSVLAVAAIYSLMNLSIIGGGAVARGHALEVHRRAVHGEAVRNARGLGASRCWSCGRRSPRSSRCCSATAASLTRRRSTATSSSPSRGCTRAASFRTSRCWSWAALRSSPRFWNLDAVISALLTSRILVQFIGQIFALHYLRKHRPDIVRPFRMWLYPLPSVIAFIGWVYIFLTSGWTFAGFGLLTLAAGVAVYSIWKRVSPA